MEYHDRRIAGVKEELYCWPLNPSFNLWNVVQTITLERTGKAELQQRPQGLPHA